MEYTKTIQDMHDLADSRGFKFISKVFFGWSEKHLWKCQNGHIWKATPCSINRGRGCPLCFGRIPKTTDFIVSKLGNRPIKFLSDKVGSIVKNYKWECEKCGYIWTSTILSVIGKGSGCPRCRGYHQTIQDMHDLAAKRGFTFCSDSYQGMCVNHLWKCNNGHLWKATPSKIKHGTGCPLCRRFLNEEKCRYIFEQLTGKLFPTDNSALGCRLQLDGYCQELNLAFEYQGRQHYELVAWNKDIKVLKGQQKRDRKKKKLCKEKGIPLIEITFRTPDAEKHIKSELNRLNITFIKNDVDWSSFKGNKTYFQAFLENCKKIDATCLSDTYVTAKTKIPVRCNKCGHTWGITPNDAQHQYGCVVCGGRQRKSIESIHKLAAERGFQFLSEEYVNARTKYPWKCLKCGNIWVTTEDGFKNVQGCRKCIIKSIGYSQLLENCKKVGVTYLGNDYVESEFKFPVRCNKCGREWETCANYLRQGKGCRCNNTNARRKN